MSDLLRLRDYQREAIDRVHDAHSGGIRGYADGMKFPAVVLPTGAGKTVIFAHMASEHLARRRNRVLVLVHRDELADQALAKIRDVAPKLTVGKVKATDNEVFADVVVASVQTASLKARLEQLVRSETHTPTRHPRKFGLIITDECHHAVAASYRKIYDAFPDADRVGFTATLARGDGVGLGSVIDDVVFSRTWLWMIRKGYLVDPVGQTVSVETLNLGQVRRSSGDYASGALGEAMVEAGAHEVIASAYREHAADRSGIVFTPSVSAAYLTAAAFDRLGITCDVVEANTPRAERRSIYDRSRSGSLQVIVNCGVLTEGFDAPWIECVVPRMTMSAPLFQQMVGRALRPHPGKDDALVLSVGGMSGRLRTLVDLEPGSVRKVRPGESLAEAVAREEEEANRPVSGKAAPFRIKVKHADLFAASKSAWLRTEGGVYFIPVTDGEVFLWPRDDGRWQVRHAPHVTARRKITWPVLHDDLSLEMAMAWGETEAEDRDHGSREGGRALKISSRQSRWRKAAEPPSAGQVAACNARGIPVPEGATRAEISDVLSVWVASRKFDPFVERLARRSAAVVSAG